MRNEIKNVIEQLEINNIVWDWTKKYTCDNCASDNIIVAEVDREYKICANCGNNNWDAKSVKQYMEKQSNNTNVSNTNFGSSNEDSLKPVQNNQKSGNSETRPGGFDEIYGNETIIRDLEVMIHSSKNRNEALEDTLFFGPPGLGKTTIASVVADERGVSFTPTLASVLKKDDIVDLLKNMTPHGILFIDEIHDLNKSLALVLYTAMEDNYVDIIEDGNAVRVSLPDFTVMASTTNPGKILPAMRSRFGNKYTLELYSEEILYKIIVGVSKKMNVGISKKAASEIAKRSRGTPRNAISLLKKARAYADVYNSNFQFSNGFVGTYINMEMAQMAFDTNNIDANGLNEMDRKYLQALNELGTVGLSVIAATLGDSEDSLEEMVEPWLLSQGYIKRSRTGREITEKGNGVLSVN